MNEPMTFLDFFSGVGGFRKGFELCGMVCKGHCEIDKFADRSYRAIHDVKEDEWYGEDITKTEPADLPRVNLWAGGFPCQDISVSGRQRGLAGKRSSLFFEIIRLLKGTPAEDRPEWLVLENVKNLLSVNRGWDFATVLHSLAEIGYHIEYGLLNSRFHGVPQNRERIYLVAYRHFRAEGGRKVFPVTAGDGKALIQLIGGTQGKRVYDPTGISCTLMSEGGGFAGRTGMYFIDLCKGNPKLTENARCIKARYRPVVIIQNNVGNKHSPTVIIASITSKTGVKAKLPTHYYIDAEDGLELPSIVLLEQLRTVDKRRLGNFIGHLSEKHICGINHALAVSIGLIESVPKKLILCLCSTCADNFYGTGAYYLRRIDPLQAAKDTCTYCNQRKGYDYELVPKRR